MDRKYTAFISYRHLPLDMAVAERLHKKIEHYRVPKELRKSPEQKTLGVVFRDRDELPLSNDLTRDIYYALDNSEFLIVICTPDTPKSLWVDREIEHFLQKHDRNHILTVLAAGTPEESIPARITHVYGEDGTVIDRREPLCAYIVADQTWKVLWNLQSEFQRLVAAILGKPLDAIRQRARAYRWKIVGSVMAVITAVALGFVGMLVSKNRQIQEQLLQTQLNESKTLVLVSQNRLEDGDRAGALESAIYALPSPGNERPYYAAAKTALENALYLYEWPSYRAYAKITEPSGISKLAISDDGGYALGLIGADRIVCYDLKTLQSLWECPRLDDYFVESLDFLEAQGAVLYTSCGGGQFILDQETGQLLHSCTLSLRITPEDFAGNERKVALIDREHAVFFDVCTGETVRSEAIDRGGYPWSSGGGYSADEKSFLMLYSGIYDGSYQLRYSCIDAETGNVTYTQCYASELEETAMDPRVIGLEDGSYFISFSYQGIRYFGRLSAEGAPIVLEGYELPESNHIFNPIRDRIRLIGSTVCMVDYGVFRTVDPETCQILSEKFLYGNPKFLGLYDDGTALYMDSGSQLETYQVTDQGVLAEAGSYDFGWEFSYFYGSAGNSEVFLAQPEDPSEVLIVRALGYLGTEAASADMLELTLSGNLVYLPKFCGVYCSDSADSIYFPDADGAGGYTHTLYHTDTRVAEAIDPPDIAAFTGKEGYGGPVPEMIGQEITLAALSEDENMAAFAGADGTLYLYDQSSGQLLSELPNEAYACDSLTFLPRSGMLLVGNLGRYTVVDTASGEVVSHFETDSSPSGHNGHYIQIREAVDGSCVFICSSTAEFDGAIVETEGWTVIHKVEGLVGYLPWSDSLVYVSRDYRAVYLQRRMDTDELIELGKQVLSDT